MHIQQIHPICNLFYYYGILCKDIWNRRKDKVPELPEFAIALQPEDYTLPPVNDVWDNIGGVT